MFIFKQIIYLYFASTFFSIHVNLLLFIRVQIYIIYNFYYKYKNNLYYYVFRISMHIDYWNVEGSYEIVDY